LSIRLGEAVRCDAIWRRRGRHQVSTVLKSDVFGYGRQVRFLLGVNRRMGVDRLRARLPVQVQSRPCRTSVPPKSQSNVWRTAAS
jgi:hypothetical protein